MLGNRNWGLQHPGPTALPPELQPSQNPQGLPLLSSRWRCWINKHHHYRQLDQTIYIRKNLDDKKKKKDLLVTQAFLILYFRDPKARGTFKVRTVASDHSIKPMSCSSLELYTYLPSSCLKESQREARHGGAHK